MKYRKQIATVIRTALFLLRQHWNESFYRSILKRNKIDNVSSAKEKAWVQKWSQLGIKAKPTQYRVFRQYIGDDINIVPEDICHDYIETILNPMRFRGYYADKNTFDKLFPNGFFPKTLLRKICGCYFDSDYRALTMTEPVLKDCLNMCSTDRIIIKPSVDGISGRGVEAYFRGENNDEWTNTKGEVLNYAYLEKHFGKNIIIQEGVVQSDYINQFNPTSVNTLRLSMYRSVKNNVCHITGAIMRIGGKGSVVDNAHAGGCYVGIYPDGKFCKEVLDQYGTRNTIFNGIDFSSNDFIYPNWDNVIEFGKSVGQYVPHHRLLALDIVLDRNNNPKLIEFNIEGYSSWLFQYTIGTAFGEFTDEIIDHCKENIDNVEELVLL